MASLNEIRKKIKIIESTSKITKAMKLIATSKLKKQKDLFLNTSEYYQTIYKVFGLVIKEINVNDYLNNPNNDITVWIVFCSSMGLCGGYNINIIKKLIANIKPEDKIVSFGKKGVNILKSKNLFKQVYANINLDEKEINSDLFGLIAKQLLDDYYLNKFKNIKIIYMKFINSLSFEPSIIDVLPFDKTNFSEMDEPTNGSYYVIEPNEQKMFKFLLKKYIQAILQGSIIESQISENASRRNAMEGATKNANDLIANYKLSFNRIRQANITQEINEIVSGSNED